MDFVKFFRGQKNKYLENPEHTDAVQKTYNGTFEDGLYFAADTHELMMNGISYGNGKELAEALKKSFYEVKDFTTESEITEEKIKEHIGSYEDLAQAITDGDIILITRENEGGKVTAAAFKNKAEDLAITYPHFDNNYWTVIATIKKDPAAEEPVEGVTLPVEKTEVRIIKPEELFIHNTINVTYEELKKLVDESQLTPGQRYRLTDYVAKVQGDDVQSANHQFDLILFAISENTLSECAQAALHDKDEYFKNCRLGSWRVWYTLNHDELVVDSKGTVYRLIDEWDNDCPYDFKNIQFKRGEEFYFTFGKTDQSLDGKALQNTIKSYNEEKWTLPNIIIKGNAFGNYFDYDCHTITLDNATYNYFGHSCSEIEVTEGCLENVFSNACTQITAHGLVDCAFGPSCTSLKLTLHKFYNSVFNTCGYLTFIPGRDAFNVLVLQGTHGSPDKQETVLIQTHEQNTMQLVGTDVQGMVKVYNPTNYVPYIISLKNQEYELAEFKAAIDKDKLKNAIDNGAPIYIQKATENGKVLVEVQYASYTGNITFELTFFDLIDYYQLTMSYDGDIEEADKFVTLQIGVGKNVGNHAEIFNSYQTEREHEANTASGEYGHAEGSGTKAEGKQSHVEGNKTNAKGDDSHAEGQETKTETGATASHAEGYKSETKATYAHAEGNTTHANGSESHAEGNGTTASGQASHAEGVSSQASGIASHAEGVSTSASASNSHAEGNTTTASGDQAHAEGSNTNATGFQSHAEGLFTTAKGESSHAEGAQTKANLTAAHAEGYASEAQALFSHAEGHTSIASGRTSHAEGNKTKASARYAHSEGSETTASGEASHVEGVSSQATGAQSHAEGNLTKSIGQVAHAEGNASEAKGNYSHAEGNTTQTTNESEHAEGKFNKSTQNKTISSVGIGENNESRKNAFEITTDGNVYINGVGNYDGTNVSTENTRSLQYVLHNFWTVIGDEEESE